MISLSKKPGKRYYYIKEGVIFDISNSKRDDSCCFEMSQDVNLECIPILKVINTNETGDSETFYYLDSIIEDGDKAVYETIESGETEIVSFKHIDHAYYERQGEGEVSLWGYYADGLCFNQLMEAIYKNYDKNLEWFNKNLKQLGIPMFMFADNGYTLMVKDGKNADFVNKNADQFTFTDEDLKLYKERALEYAARKAANAAINKYYHKVKSISIIEY